MGDTVKSLKNKTAAVASRLLARIRGRQLSWTATMHAIKYQKHLTLEEDIRHEICEFYDVSEDVLRELENRYGAFTSRSFQLYVYSLFEGRTGQDSSLFDAYADASLPYSLMLGLGCQRYAHLFWSLEELLPRLRKLSRRPVAVDYGSGVGDTALLLATCGFDVHLVDLPDKKSSFARWRLERRGFRPHFIPVTASDPYPAIPRPVDLIVTIEVWEHLRQPIRALQNLISATEPGQSFLLNTNENFNYDPEGDHLAEGIQQGQSTDYRSLYESNWRLFSGGNRIPGHGRLYIRI